MNTQDRLEAIAVKKLILGPPGTGKTTTLLNIVNDYIAGGTPPERIAFVTFTKSGAQEAVKRACDKFGLPERSFPHFKTLHAMCYRDTGARGVMQWRDYRELSEVLGYSVTDNEDRMTRGNIIRHCEEQSRTRCIDLQEAVAQLSPDLDYYVTLHYAETLARFKEVHGVPDFTDLLQRYIDKDQPLDVDVVIVDEAQDLTELQWRMVDVMCRDARDIYYAGDDDQTIHVWAGASLERFMSLGEQCDETTVLSHSYRLPMQVHAYAKTTLLNRIRQRYKKEFTPREEEGAVHWLAHSAMPKLPIEEGEWMMLARNKSGLEDYKHMLRSRGYAFQIKGEVYLGPLMNCIRYWESLRRGEEQPYKNVKSIYDKCIQKGIELGQRGFKGGKGQHFTLEDLMQGFGLKTDLPWFEAFDRVDIEDRKYLQKCLRDGDGFKSRINLMTMHSSKGMECDNVVMLSDCSRASVEELYREPDSEHRVFYVAATRAKENLYIIGESTENFYEL